MCFDWLLRKNKHAGSWVVVHCFQCPVNINIILSTLYSAFTIDTEALTILHSILWYVYIRVCNFMTRQIFMVVNIWNASSHRPRRYYLCGVSIPVYAQLIVSMTNVLGKIGHCLYQYCSARGELMLLYWIYILDIVLHKKNKHSSGLIETRPSVCLSCMTQW